MRISVSHTRTSKSVPISTTRSGRSGRQSLRSKMRAASGAVRAVSSTYFAFGQRRRMSASAAFSLPGSAKASPLKPRPVAITSAVPNGEG
jgi:hypothetical protein